MIVPTSVKFDTRQAEWLQRKACEEGHGRKSRVLKALVDRAMLLDEKRNAKKKAN